MSIERRVDKQRVASFSSLDNVQSLTFMTVREQTRASLSEHH